MEPRATLTNSLQMNNSREHLIFFFSAKNESVSNARFLAIPIMAA